METKSRYEVIAELENKKRQYIMTKDGLDQQLRSHEKDLKDLNRDVEDKEEEISNFKDSMKQNKITYDELIKSIDESLKRFSNLNK